MDTLKTCVSKYEAWLKRDDESKKQGQELLNRVKTCSGSNGSNWSLVLADVDRLFAQAYRELVD